MVGKRRTILDYIPSFKEPLIDKLQHINAHINDGYTPDSMATFKSVLAKAEEIGANDSCTEEEVKNIMLELDTAAKKLVRVHRVVAIDGLLHNGATSGMVAYGGAVTFSANEPPIGKKFAYIEVNGSPFYYKNVLKMPVCTDIIFRAVYVNEEEVVAINPAITCYSSYDGINSIGRIIAHRNLPSECTVLEHGILITDELGFNAYGDSFSMESKRKIVRTAKSTTNAGLNGTNLSKVKGAWYAKGYVKYQVGNEQPTYIYSNYCDAMNFN